MDWFYNIAGGLAVTAVSATVWLAYQHPRSYSTLANWVLIALYAAMLIWMGYVSGYSDGTKEVVEYVASGGAPEEYDATPFGGAVTLYLGLAMLVLTALRFIHRLRDD